MKKILLCLPFSLLFLLFFLFSPPPSYAQEYGNEVLKFGPNVAGDVSEGNFAKIRREYNTNNPGARNKWIPTTIILTQQTLDTPGRAQEISQLAQKYGIMPTVRLAGTNFNGPLTAADGQSLANSLKSFNANGFPQPVYVAFGNEPNYTVENGNQAADPIRYAAALKAFMDTMGGERFSLNLRIMNGASNSSLGDFLGNMSAENFWRAVNQAQPGLLANLDGFANHSYMDPNRWASEYAFLQSLGLGNKPLLLLEVGPNPDPNAYPSRDAQIAAYKNYLENIYKIYGPEKMLAVTPLICIPYCGAPDEIKLIAVFDEFGNVHFFDSLGNEYIISPGLPIFDPSFTPVAYGDWFEIKKSFNGILTSIPEGEEPKDIWVKSEPDHEPEPYGELKAVTQNLISPLVLGSSSVLGTSSVLDQSGVWERLRLPHEVNLSPLEKEEFQIKPVDALVYFDCLGGTEGYSAVDISPLSQTRGVLGDLTQRLARTGELETTIWSQAYDTTHSVNEDWEYCKNPATGEIGKKTISSAEGGANIVSEPAAVLEVLTDILDQIEEWMSAFCQHIPIIGYLCSKTEFTILVQPGVVVDNLAADVPELSYTLSQKKHLDNSEEKFGGGIFRIFFQPGMDQIGEKEGSLLQGELIHGLGQQDYQPPEGWSPTIDMVDVPDDLYGQGGTLLSYNYVQKSLRPAVKATSTPPGPVIPPVTGGLNFIIPYRDSSVKVIDPEKIKALVKSYWPESKVYERWDEIVQKAKEKGINPAFALAIWIEESGASGANAQSDFGCFPGGDTSQTVPFARSLNCFINFTANEHPNDFTDWVRYFCGPKVNPICSNNPGFLGRIKYWYSKLVPPGNPGALTPIE